MSGVLTAVGSLYDIFRYVHRDVKPDNILVDEHGEGKLTDFGMCVKIDDACLPENIGDGTPEYSAPETSTRHGASILSEIYAVGVIFVEGLMNNCPFGEQVYGCVLCQRPCCTVSAGLHWNHCAISAGALQSVRDDCNNISAGKYTHSGTLRLAPLFPLHAVITSNFLRLPRV